MAMVDTIYKTANQPMNVTSFYELLNIGSFISTYQLSDDY